MRNGRKPHFQHPRATVSDLQKEGLLDMVFEHLYEDLVPFGRESCQSQLRRLTLVAKGWTEPVSKRLYKNPYLGCKERAHELDLCLQSFPERGKLVKKLIFGEGSSTGAHPQ